MTFYTDFPVIELDAISVEEDDVKYLLRAMISYDDLKVTKK